MNTFDFESVYDGLKDFQKRTVDYVTQRFYYDDPPARRFLVADEVGLGKTLVARGVIAKTAQYLEDHDDDRIDVVYICSNTDIARQNIRRLALPGFGESAFSTRLTLLPLHHGLSNGRFNFVSFTPRTAFELKSNLGWSMERVLLYWLLKRKWPDLVGRKKGPMRVMQGGMGSLDNFESAVRKKQSELNRIDHDLEMAFSRAIDDHDVRASVRGEPGLKARYEDLSRVWMYESYRTQEEHHVRSRFVGDLRNLLAKTCVQALQPDLVILDEFQRFRHLLDEDSEASELAHALFNYSEEERSARVLLLSATPYKMYTIREEAGQDDHYSDFLGTAEFLMEGDTADFRSDLSAFGRDLTRLDPDNLDPLIESKTRIERALRRVMCRTERLVIGDDRNGMLTEVAPHGVTLEPDDLMRYMALDNAMKELGAGQPIEYWKSAPYFANFWDEYEAGRKFNTADPALARHLRDSLSDAGALIPWDEWRRYQQFDPGNARLRSLISGMIDSGAWKLLWLPPSLPYYQPGRPFDIEGAPRLTKRLVFSAWNVVPKAVSTILSYEAERRMMNSTKRRGLENSPAARSNFTEPLRFPTSSPSGMSAFAFVYPSPALARLGDPLVLAGTLSGTPSAQDVLVAAAGRIMDELSRVSMTIGSSDTGAPDDRWYWVAPLLLDRESEADWLRRRNAAQAWTGPDSRSGGAGFEAHIERANETAADVLGGRLELGPLPDDLGRVLAMLAVGGPANVAYRAFQRMRRGDTDGEIGSLRDAAANVAWGFRSLFNTPEVSQLIRGLPGRGPYWQRALAYCVAGNLQAVMDEYVYVLREFRGILGEIDDEAMADLATSISEVVSLRASDLHAHDLNDPEPVRMRVRFALPFGQRQSDEEAHLRRAGFVRTAFNSPFWPFVLTTTSVGQEGLDFHLYCHAVVHWNLPSNPVDLEQREGRVHRYMGHAVRKNLAELHGSEVVGGQRAHPWEHLLEQAVSQREEESDLVPYWIYPGSHLIERHVPRLPLSKEESVLPDLRRSLAVYRLVFGQARQQDMLEVLKRNATTDDELGMVARGVVIDLSPPLGKETAP